MAKTAEVSNPPTEVRDAATSRGGASSRVNSSVDLSSYADVIKDNLSRAADFAIKAYGSLQLSGQADVKPDGASGAGTGVGSGEGEAHPPAGGGADVKKGKPVPTFDPSASGGCFGDPPGDPSQRPSDPALRKPIDLNRPGTGGNPAGVPRDTVRIPEFDPSAGGGCFGIPGLPEGVGLSHAGGNVPLDLNMPPVDGDAGGEMGPAPMHRPTDEVHQKPIEGSNPLVEDGCFGDYGDNAGADGQIKGDVKPLNTGAQETRGKDENPAGDMIRSAAETLGKIAVAEPQVASAQTLMRSIAASITEAWNNHKVFNDGCIKSTTIKDRSNFIDGVAREQFNAALNTLGTELGNTFQESQKLAKEVFDAVADKNFYSAKMRDSVKKAAAELGANPESPETQKAIKALKGALARGGVNAEFGHDGLKISDGSYAVEIDSNGNLQGYRNLDNPPPESTSVATALKGLHHSYIQNALNMHQMKHANDRPKDVTSTGEKTFPHQPRKIPVSRHEIPVRFDADESSIKY